MAMDPPPLNHHNHHQLQHHQEEEDPFVRFIDYARSVLSPEDDEDFDPNIIVDETQRPSWNWIASRVLKTCAAYSSGVTAAILLSDLSQVYAFVARKLIVKENEFQGLSLKFDFI